MNTNKTNLLHNPENNFFELCRLETSFLVIFNVWQKLENLLFVFTDTLNINIGPTETGLRKKV